MSVYYIQTLRFFDSVSLYIYVRTCSFPQQSSFQCLVYSPISPDQVQKRLNHNAAIFSQFSVLSLPAPPTTAEIPHTLAQLQEKLVSSLQCMHVCMYDIACSLSLVAELHVYNVYTCTIITV